MSDYPINLKAQNIHALVIGAGEVGMRKIDTLLKCKVSSITVVDKNIHERDFPYKNNKEILFFSREYSESDLDNHNLIFIATDNKDLNSSIATACNNKRILCNVISKPEEGSFTLPAIIQKENILLSVSTGGQSPALSRVLKEDIESFLDSGYSDLCIFLGKLRPVILKLEMPSAVNKAIFTFFVHSPQKQMLFEYFSTKEQSLLLEILEIFDKTLEEDMGTQKNEVKAIIQKFLTG